MLISSLWKNSLEVYLCARECLCLKAVYTILHATRGIVFGFLLQTYVSLFQKPASLIKRIHIIYEFTVLFYFILFMSLNIVVVVVVVGS